MRRFTTEVSAYGSVVSWVFPRSKKTDNVICYTRYLLLDVSEFHPPTVYQRGLILLLRVTGSTRVAS